MITTPPAKAAQYIWAVSAAQAAMVATAVMEITAGGITSMGTPVIRVALAEAAVQVGVNS